MTRLLPLLLVALVFAPAADARCAKKGCRKMPGRAVTVRASVPMVAASLDSIVAPGAPSSGTPSPDPASAPAPGAPLAPPARLGVTAREWSLVLSRTTLPAGRAIVQLKNIGEDAHNLRLEGGSDALDVPLAESGEVKQADGTLPAGDYKVYCALPGHEAAGMRARLTVTP
jgi:hypothetical protein